MTAAAPARWKGGDGESGVRATGLILMGQAASVAFTLGISIVVSRALGSSGNGFVILATSVPAMFAIAIELGLGAAATVLIHKGHMTESSAASALLLYGLIAAALVSFLDLGVLSRVVALALPGWAESERLAVVLNTVFTALSLLGAYLLVATGRTLAASLVWSLDRLLSFSGVVGLALCHALSQSALALVFPIAYAACAVVTWATVGRLLRFGRLPCRRQWGALLRLGVGIGLGNSLQALNYRFDTLLVNSLVSQSAVGVYGAAASLASSLWYVPNVVALIWLPRVARMRAEAARDQTNRVMGRTVALTAGGALLLALTGRWLLVTLFGSSFGGGWLALVALLPGTVAFVVPKVLNSRLLSRGITWIAIASATAGLAITIALDLLLIPRMGILGAALTSTFSYIVIAIGYSVASALVGSRESHLDAASDVV